MNYQTKLRNLYELGKQHIIDTTAGLTGTSPIFAFFENVVVGMSDAESLKARLIVCATNYFGLGSAFSRGRDLSKKIFKVKDTAFEKKQWLHDTLYLMGFCGVVSPIIYKFSGVEGKEILEGTLTSMGLSLVNGYIVGYSVDLFRDFTGIKKSERLPRRISNLSPRLKKGLVALLVAGSVASIGTIYKLTPPKQEELQQEKYNIETIVNQEI